MKFSNSYKYKDFQEAIRLLKNKNYYGACKILEQAIEASDNQERSTSEVLKMWDNNKKIVSGVAALKLITQSLKNLEQELTDEDKEILYSWFFCLQQIICSDLDFYHNNPYRGQEVQVRTYNSYDIKKNYFGIETVINKKQNKIAQDSSSNFLDFTIYELVQANIKKIFINEPKVEDILPELNRFLLRFSDKIENLLNDIEENIITSPIKMNISLIKPLNVSLWLEKVASVATDITEIWQNYFGSAADWYQKGNHLFALKNYQEAISTYDKAIEAYSKTIISQSNFSEHDLAKVYTQKGLALSRLQNNEEALRCYEKAIKFSQNPNIYLMMGRALSAIGKKIEALTYYNKAIELDVKNVAAYLSKGDILYDMGYNLPALGSYESVIEQQGTNSPEAYNKRGKILFELGEHEKALTDYNEAIKLNSMSAEAHYDKGKALYQLKRYQEAIECYDKAIELRPEAAHIYYTYKANALHSLSNDTSAITCYDIAIHLAPNDSYAYACKAKLLYEKGDYGGAITCYDVAIRLKSEAALYYNMAIILSTIGNSKSAIRCYIQATELDKNYSNLEKNFSQDFANYFYDIAQLKQLALSQIKEKEQETLIEVIQDSIKDYMIAIKYQKNFAAAYYELSKVWWVLSKKELAKKYYNKAIEFDKGYADAAYNYRAENYDPTKLSKENIILSHKELVTLQEIFNNKLLEINLDQYKLAGYHITRHEITILTELKMLEMQLANASNMSDELATSTITYGSETDVSYINTKEFVLLNACTNRLAKFFFAKKLVDFRGELYQLNSTIIRDAIINLCQVTEYSSDVKLNSLSVNDVNITNIILVYLNAGLKVSLEELKMDKLSGAAYATIFTLQIADLHYKLGYKLYAQEYSKQGSLMLKKYYDIIEKNPITSHVQQLINSYKADATTDANYKIIISRNTDETSLKIKQQIMNNVLLPVQKETEAGRWNKGYFSTGTATKDYVKDSYIAEILGNMKTKENIEVAQMFCFEAIVLTIMAAKEKNFTCLESFIKTYPKLVVKIIKEYPEYCIESSLLNKTMEILATTEEKLLNHQELSPIFLDISYSENISIIGQENPPSEY